jgi:hypothetical protein
MLSFMPLAVVLFTVQHLMSRCILQVLDDLINRAKDTRQELDLEDLQVSAFYSYSC